MNEKDIKDGGGSRWKEGCKNRSLRLKWRWSSKRKKATKVVIDVREIGGCCCRNMEV